MHIYAFGSVCRGDVSVDSDVDLLAVVDTYDARFDPSAYSIYSYKRIQAIWLEGNPFAWHLFLESRLLFASDSQDFIKSMGNPVQYKHCQSDCSKFYQLFCEAFQSATGDASTRVFDLSTMFLGIRNFATCFSLGMTSQPDFSRSAARHLGPDSLEITEGAYRIFERARILATRGYGAKITDQEFSLAVESAERVVEWMHTLSEKVDRHA